MAKGTLVSKLNPPSFNLQEILDRERVEAHFQPIVSLKRRCIVGLEGLSRGLHAGTHFLIPPKELFEQAVLQGKELELDRLCRYRIMDDFRRIHSLNPDFILFLNLDTSILLQDTVGLGELQKQVFEMGLKPENIALEIIESDIEDLKQLQRFVQIYRDYGFLIALDDVGVGHSNLNRIPLIRPDILKIDRYLIQDIQKDYYKQEVLKSLLRMARHLGTAIIAEGVETQEEAVCLLDMDVDMIQGYYFARPLRQDLMKHDPVLVKIDDLGEVFKYRLIKKLGVKKFNMNRFYTTIFELEVELSRSPSSQFDSILRQKVGAFPDIECIYVLSESGIQVSENIFHQGKTRRNPIFFKPSPKGADHTMKDYFYFLVEAGLSKTSFITEPYLSMTSGTSCVTLSALFKGIDGTKYVLCLDITTQALRKEHEL